MPSAFDAMLGAGRESLDSFMSCEVEIEEQGKEPRTIIVVLGKVKTEDREQDGSELRVQVRYCRLVSELNGSTLTNIRHDARIIDEDGIGWSIDDTMTGKAGGTELQLRRADVHRRERRSYRAGKP